MQYPKRNLRIYAMASTGNVEKDKNTSVTIAVKAAGKVSNPQYYDTEMVLGVKCDGKIHDFSEFEEYYRKDFMRLDTDTEYYIEYEVCEDLEPAPKGRATVTIMMEATGLS